MLSALCCGEPVMTPEPACLPAPAGLRDLILDLMNANRALPFVRARAFARAILEAELREDYVLMNRLIQDALYGATHEQLSDNPEES